MSGPDISIVVPAWGAYAGRPLREALESLRAQDVPARIIVVDNASEIPLAVHPPLEVIRAPRRLSVGAARNLGLERVNTPYVLFWDADDLILPGTLGFLRARLDADPELMAVAAAIVEADARAATAGRQLGLRPSPAAHGSSPWRMRSGRSFPPPGRPSCGPMPSVRAAASEMRTAVRTGCLGPHWPSPGACEFEDRPGRVYRRLGESLWEQRRSAADLRAHAAGVRSRLRGDPAVPSWARALAPALVVPQTVVLLGLAPVARAARRAYRCVAGKT